MGWGINYTCSDITITGMGDCTQIKSMAHKKGKIN